MTARRSSDSFSGACSGQLIGGKYLLLETLGEGGMGQVWAARNLATNAEVAIKLLRSPTNEPEVIARFRREAHATAQLCHRGILRVFDLVEGREPGEPLAIVMERLHGKTLAAVLHEEGPLTIEATLGVVLPVLQALHHVHRLGIVHRDLKPENVFLAFEPDGEVVPKLVDFGISKMLRDGNPPITGGNQIVGTPHHMSPEQLRGTPIDARSDVFCAGIVLYMCLTGHNPFVPTDPLRALIAVLETDPVRPEQMPLPIWNVIERSLAKNPDDRYGSAMELSEALSRCRKELNGKEAHASARPSGTDRTLTDIRLFPLGIPRRTVGLGIVACFAAVVVAALFRSLSPAAVSTLRPPR